jgi:hypothetical protein
MKKLVLILMALFPVSLVAQETIYQYTTVPITYEEQNWLNLNQTQEGSNFWDDEVRQIDIGFEFEFYGETFSTLYLSNNGLLSFTSPINGCCSGEPLPTSSFYDYSIFFLWTDLVNIDSLNPYISSYGAEGNRRLTIGFYDMPVFYDSTFSSTFEISLFEGTNYVFLNYGDINTGNRTVTAGLQGDSLLGEYTQLYYGNDAGSTLSYTSWLFYSGVYIDPGDSQEESSEVNCAVEFYNPSCQLADDTTSSEQGNLIPEAFSTREERLLANELETQQEVIQEVTLEEMLAVETREEQIQNTETSNILADNIDANVLDLVLAIVEATSSSEQNSQTGSSTVASGSAESNAVDNMDTSATESAEAAFGILAQGQAFAQESIANTVEQSQTEASMLESFVADQQVISIDESQTVAFVEMPQETQQDNIVNEFGQIQFAGNEFNQPEQFDEQKAIESILANSQESNKQDENEVFNEPVMVMTDMAMSAATGFNPVFSISNLEMTGVLNQREEKSDAEKRAEQVVAANKEQQDAINANYMDADQSGILAAMDTGTDFTQYRNAMLRDVAFYKPEDIYKNVIYRDNVRGMYFLEKGSTDTYKQMVEEQYKNE